MVIAKPSSKKSAKAKSRASIEVTLTHPDKVIYPREGYTKQDVADYYAVVSQPMIRALAGRPISFERWQQGIAGPSWYQQNIAREAASWMKTVETPGSHDAPAVQHLVIDRAETLRWLAQHSALTIHTWSARLDKLMSPDWIVFDLDPADGQGIAQAVDVAIVLRAWLEKNEIKSIPKTSGKRGIHVFVPIERTLSHQAATEFAVKVGTALLPSIPQATMERSKALRHGRLYFDCFQNGYGKTVVAPYSLRGLDGAPVSTPLLWKEVTKRLDPGKFTLKTVPRRIDKVGDLFGDALEHRNRIR